jgi:hypothetical protein
MHFTCSATYKDSFFGLEIKRLEKSWPEKGEREVQWFSPTAAAER